MPSQQRQRSVDSPVEVKQEPFEEDMNEGYEEEYPNEEYICLGGQKVGFLFMVLYSYIFIVMDKAV